MLETFHKERIAAASPDEIGDFLEQGRIVYFPECPVSLPDDEDLDRLRSELPRQLKLKNVSYHPEADRVKGLDENSSIADLSYRALTQHSQRVTEFLHQVMPTLATGMRVGTCSFRPMQECGRNLKAHASNDLVHVDAGAYGATNGDRILRFFVNVNPTEDRVWATKGRLPDLLDRHGNAAGVRRGELGSLARGPVDQLRSFLIGAVARLGVPLATVLDSSPYDRTMRRFHNFMKDSPAFQQDMEYHQEFRFEPFSAWMVFTDMVSHACLSGQHALVYTALVRLTSCRHPDLAPLNILREVA